MFNKRSWQLRWPLTMKLLTPNSMLLDRETISFEKRLQEDKISWKKGYKCSIRGYGSIKDVE